MLGMQVKRAIVQRSKLCSRGCSIENFGVNSIYMEGLAKEGECRMLKDTLGLIVTVSNVHTY